MFILGDLLIAIGVLMGLYITVLIVIASEGFDINMIPLILLPLVLIFLGYRISSHKKQSIDQNSQEIVEKTKASRRKIIILTFLVLLIILLVIFFYSMSIYSSVR